MKRANKKPLFASPINLHQSPNSRLCAFTKDIENDKYLMMVDVPGRRVEEIRALFDRRHPEGIPGGVEPAIPAFP